MKREKLVICGHEFKIVDNRLIYVEEDSKTYRFTKDQAEIFGKIVEDNLDDYYLERVYKFITTMYKDIDHILKGSIRQKKYTDKIKKVINNCAKNPEGDIEYEILSLFRIFDISWLPYIQKLDELHEKLIIMYALMLHEIPEKYVSGRVYQFDYFNIVFDKYEFSLTINAMENASLQKLAMANMDNIKGLNLMECDIVGAHIFMNKQRYNIFDSVIEYLQGLVENA